MIPFDIPGPIKNLQPGALDSWRGPYATVAEACAAILNVVVDGRNFREGKIVDIGVEPNTVPHRWIGGFTDGNLTSEKFVKEIYASSNLFNNSAINSGQMLKDGSLKVDALRFFSIPIKVNPSSTYRFRSNEIETGASSFTEFDANMHVLPGGSDVATTTINTTASTAYIIVSGLRTGLADYMLNAGANILSFTPFTIDLELDPKVRIPTSAIPGVRLKSDLISKTDVNFVKKAVGKNKFNKNNAGNEIGFQINPNNGTTFANAGVNITHFIPVEAGKKYTVSAKQRVVWFTTTKVFISASNIDDTNKTQTAPSNAAYSRASVLTADWANFQFEEGVSNTIYEPYIETDILNGIGIDESALPANIRKNDVKITFNDLSFAIFKIGTNKFNKNASDRSMGKYVVSSTGLLSDNANYNSTGYVPINANFKYTVSWKHNIAFYNLNKVFISGSPSTDTSKTFTTPTNAAYMIAAVNIAFWDAYQIVEGESEKPYEAYEEYYELSGVKQPGSSSTPVVSDLPIEYVIPSRLYMLKGNENSVYLDQITNKWKQDVNYLRMTGQSILSYDRFARITNPTTEGNVSVALYDTDFNVLSSKNTLLQIGDPATNTGSIVHEAIGDSYTFNGAWQSIIRQTIPGYLTAGMRKAYGDGLIRNEGRGGWTISMYFTQLFSTTDSFTPFMHPSGYNYLGNTDFWKKAKTLTTSYEHGYFVNIADFDGTTGLRSFPVLNDLMYDDVAATYKYWSGSAWTNVSLTTANFAFNYAKYRSIWSIPAPNLLSVMLGVNDFRNLTSKESVIAAFALYKSRLDTLIASVKADTPTVKIAIMLPVIQFGKMDNITGQFTKMQRFMMFQARSLLIQNYDNRIAENIYVVDAGSAVDPEFGFQTQFDKPFASYTGTETRKMNLESPHPSTQGYYELGKPMAAFIQKTR